MTSMRVRKSNPGEMKEIVRLARKYDLDYTDMENDGFWVAEEDGRIRGFCGLKRHPDCVELCALGVEEECRHRGFGGKLVRAVLEDVSGDLYLATIIPHFFVRLGFKKTEAVPVSMNKTADWCAGCKPELCNVMLKPARR